MIMSRKTDPELRQALTPRQIDCIDLAARGCCKKIIARKLMLSLSAVHVHLAGARKFYKVDSTLKAVLKHLGHEID
jgi:DNA-binding NarL/FixJ family response regulator